ncbi:hypothetical protein ACSEN8_03290 [Pseudomonas aeruginosa]
MNREDVAIDVTIQDVEILRNRVAELETVAQQVGDLLAVIHRDGGHYQDEHGIAKAIIDAKEVVNQDRIDLNEWQHAAETADSGAKKLADYAVQLEGKIASKHPEQAGGDERAALQELIRVRDWVKNRRGQPEKLKNTGQTYIMIEKCETLDMLEWAIERARAAMAPPSPDHAVQAHDIPMLIASEHANPDYAMGWNDCRAKIIGASSAAQAEQAEAERPEVVARVVHSNPVVLGQCGPLNANDELMTVAQHAASVARWAEMFNRVEQQRDAALARVAELEGKLTDWVHEGFRLNEALAVAKAQQLHDLDKQCRDDVARALGLRPNQERGFAWSYLLASIKSCVKASGDSAQAQHSVPKEFIGRLSEFLAQRGATGKALLRELRAMLAAAPAQGGE